MAYLVLYSAYQPAASLSLDHRCDGENSIAKENNRYGDGNVSQRNLRIRTSTGEPAASAVPGHHLHGDDRQPAIRLDVLRQSHEQAIRLGAEGHRLRVHAVRAVRDLAGADRGLVRRSPRAPDRRDLRRRARRPW